MKYIYISVVIPVYNEEDRIKECFNKIEAYFSNYKNSYEIIFVNDASTDNTAAIIKKEIRKNSNYKIIEIVPNHGKGYAIKQGVEKAKGKYILFSDADFSTPINELEKLMLFVDNFPIVIGSRYLNKESIKIKQSLIRRILSRLGNIAIKLFLGLSYSDTQCGFKLFQAEAAKEVFSKLTIKRWGFDIEILTIAKILKYSVKEVAVSWSDDKSSKLRAGRDAVNTFRELVKIKKNIKENKYK